MKAFSITEAIKYGWKTLREHFVFLTSLIVGLFIINIGINVATQALDKADLNLLLFATTILSVVVSVIIGMGLIYVALKLYDENMAGYRDILEPAPLFWRYLGSSIVYVVIVILGLILLIVPGIIWAIKYNFYKYAVIDEKLGVMDSIRRSGEITKGEKWHLFLFGIVLVLLNVLGALAFIVGLIVTIPITMMAVVYVYRKLLHRKLVPASGTLKTGEPNSPREAE